jgi:hypothetical protein
MSTELSEYKKISPRKEHVVKMNCSNWIISFTEKEGP